LNWVFQKNSCQKCRKAWKIERVAGLFEVGWLNSIENSTN
jgi:hypothetical protein